MQKLLLLLLITISSLAATAQQETRIATIIRRVDSTMNAQKKYSKILKKIAAIPATEKVQAIIYFDSLDDEKNTVNDANGDPLPEDICCYKIGRAAKGKEPKYIYYVYYSVNQNLILRASEKEGWIDPKTKEEIRQKKTAK